MEDPITTEPDRDDMSIERRNVGERPTTSENGMFKFALEYYFMIFYFFYKVPRVNVLTQAHDFQINDSIFYSANMVRNWFILNASFQNHEHTVDQYQ